MEFKAVVSSFFEDENLWANHLPIPNDIYIEMLKICPDKRVKCTLNGVHTYYCAMMPKGELHYLLLNNDILKKLHLSIGSTVDVNLEKNDTQYGVPICDEFREVLLSDEIGSDYFHKLTAGKQRTLINVINKYKNPQLRIDRSILILQHLIEMKGQVDFKIILEKFRS